MPEENKTTEAYKKSVNGELTTNPNQWNGGSSAKVIRAIIESLPGIDGKPIELSSDDEDIVTLASRPTQDLQVRVVKSVIQRNGGHVDSATEKLIKKVVSPTMFKLELQKKGKIRTESDDLGLD